MNSHVTQPLPVVLCSVVRNGSILLIKRARGDYTGLWGLPGGKIETDEHLSHAACRELHEETALRADFLNIIAVVSEHLMENGLIIRHFLLHVCALLPCSKEITPAGEGQLGWFELEDIGSMRATVIPSDYRIIEKLIRKPRRGTVSSCGTDTGRPHRYYDCVLVKRGTSYSLKSTGTPFSLL
jgi:ADP-ribose pyrophosphatase YjhB (NUDIX family)